MASGANPALFLWLINARKSGLFSNDEISKTDNPREVIMNYLSSVPGTATGNKNQFVAYSN